MKNNNIKILVFSPNAVENGRGGEISSMELASGLNSYYEVTFVHTNLFYGEKLLDKSVIKERLKDIKKIVRIDFATLNFSNYLFSFPLPHEIYKLNKLVKEHDVVYISILNIKFGLIFLFFLLINRKTNLIVGYRKPLHSEKIFSLYNLKYRTSILIYSLFKSRIYHHTLSRTTKRYLKEFYKSENIVNIVHGINLENYREDNFIFKDKNVLKYIYIGYLDDVHKGIGQLIKAIDKLLSTSKDMDISFEICGMGPLSAEVKELEKKYPKYIQFNGYVSNELVPDYYKRGDVYLFTSRREPFPRTLMEALAANLVILCSKTIGSVELLRDKEFAFFLKELDHNIIIREIEQIYKLWKENPGEIKKLQKKAKNYVFKNYSTVKEIQAFKDLIGKITDEF